MPASQDRTIYLKMFVNNFSAKLQEKYQVTRMESYDALCDHIKTPLHAKCWLLSIDRRTLTYRIVSTNPKSEWYYPPEQFWAESDDNVIFARDYGVPSSLNDLLRVNGYLMEKDIYDELFLQHNGAWLEVYNDLINYNPGWKKHLNNRTVGAVWP